MNIDDTKNQYLVIHKLEAEEINQLKANIEKLNYFKLTPNVVLICSSLDQDAIAKEVTHQIQNLGRVTFLQLNTNMFGAGVSNGFTVETVFDK